jgi:hypothetical protein
MSRFGRMASAARRLVVLVPSAVAAALVGLLALDLWLRLAARPAPEGVPGDEPAAVERIREDLEAVASSGDRESFEGQWRTARWLAGRASGLGYAVELREYEREGRRFPNVIVSRVPVFPGPEYVAALAHFDSRSDTPGNGAPGADDNGSGLAVLLEVARRVREVETEHPIVFCFFSNEEVDEPGSRAFTARARREGLRFRAAVNVDVVGYNRPARLADLSALAVRGSWRGRAGALWVQLGNGLTALRAGRDTLVVAGRPANARLVEEVADALEGSGGLSVVENVRDDCG